MRPVGRGAFGANRWLLAISVLIALAGVVTWVMRSRSPRVPSELKQKQLTSNFVANTVTSGAISLDEKYLAYVDPLGVHVQFDCYRRYADRSPAGVAGCKCRVVDCFMAS